MLRQKRCLTTTPLQLFEQAVKEINWPFCLRSLVALRPAWILMPHKRRLEGCLCAMCLNPSLLLRGLNKVVKSLKRGDARDKAHASTIELPTSPSSLVSSVLCPIEDGKEMNNFCCYSQTCKEVCGKRKLRILFSPLLSVLGDREITVFQHELVTIGQRKETFIKIQF